MEEKRIKTEQDKLKEKQKRSNSPFVRIQDLDTQSAQDKDENKQNLGDQDKNNLPSKPSTSRKSDSQHKNIKKWDSHGKGGNIKMSSTTKHVKFSHVQKQDRTPHRLSQASGLKPSTEDSESMDEEELKEITLDEALMKIEKLMSQIKELDESRKKIYKNTTMTDISKKLRCKPINERIKEHRRVMRKYEKVRAIHLGILDKLPKDSPLYAFAFNCQIAHRMQQIAHKKIEEEKQCVENFLQY